MPITKRGIYHNLKESKYVVSNSEITFFFSSEFYLTKFLEGYQENRMVLRKRFIKAMVDIPLNMNMLSDIAFYETIEKRGFRATVNALDISSKDLYHYALRQMSREKTLDWFRLPKKLGVVNG